MRLRRRPATCLGLWLEAAVLIFYSIGAFGFFMGVPAFGLLPGIAAGLFMGGRAAHTGVAAEQVRAVGTRTGAFTTGVLAVACVASAILALGGPMF